MIAAFLSWLYQLILVLFLKNGRKSLSNSDDKSKQEEQCSTDVAVEKSTTPEVVVGVGSPTPLIIDTSPIVPIPPVSSPKKTVTFELDLRPPPRSPSRSPTRYAESTTAAEIPFGTTQNANGKQRLSFHWRGGNCHQKVKMTKQKPQRTRRGSMHLFEEVHLECLRIMEGAVGNFLKRCPLLKSICIERCSVIGGSREPTEPLLTNAILTYLALHCPLVEDISWTHCENLDGAVISDSALLIFMQRCGSLRQFRLCFTAGLSELGFAILSQNQKLEILEISCCDIITDAALDCLSYGSAPLKELILGGDRNDGGLVTDAGFATMSIGHFSDSLEIFKYYNADNITNAGLLSLSDCTQLQHVLLHECQRVNDVGISCLADALTSLMSLDMRGIERCSGQCLRSLGHGCNQLKILHLEGIRHVQDDDLIALMQGCHTLQILFVTGAKDVTDISLRYLSEHLSTTIEELSLRISDHITDQGLYYLSTSCKKLMLLDVGGNHTKITEDGLWTLFEGCPLLEDVFTRGIVNDQILLQGLHSRSHSQDQHD